MMLPNNQVWSCNKRFRITQLVFIVAPSLRAERLIWSLWRVSGCPSVRLYLTEGPPRKSLDLKNSKTKICFSSFWATFSGGPPPPTTKGKNTKWPCDGPRWFKLKKMSKCQKDVKKSKRCQMSKSQTHKIWRRFTKKTNSHNEVHTYWCQFWRQIWRSPKLFKNTFYAHFEGFWSPSYVTSKSKSICVNLIMWIYFFCEPPP